MRMAGANGRKAYMSTIYHTEVPYNTESSEFDVTPYVKLERVSLTGGVRRYSHWRTERGGTGVTGGSVPSTDFEDALTLYDLWIEEFQWLRASSL